jgi:hypothetical protein
MPPPNAAVQTLSPGPHRQTPSVHVAPVAQTFAQAPQSRLFVDVSTHVVAPPGPAHAVSPVAQPA